MGGLEFFHNVDAHDSLVWLGAKPNKDGVDCAYIAGTRLGNITEVPVREIKNHDWDTWMALMLGERSAKIMKHITRIVGYYSELQNWNASKKAELRDRHNGSYGVPEAVQQAIAAA
jgi:hypothetical protein